MLSPPAAAAGRAAGARPRAMPGPGYVNQSAFASVVR